MILGRDRRVIDREVKRNKVSSRAYIAKLAQVLTDKRETDRCKKKLEKDHELEAFVVENLRKELSPEQIAGLLKEQSPDHLEGKNVCHESIYQYIYEGEGQYGGLYKHLRHSHKKRRTRGKRTHRKPMIPERISIHERPSIINDKARFGDFECDLVEGKRRDKQALSVQYERRSQYVKIHRVQDKTAQQTTNAIFKTKESLPEGFMKSITFDNGTETTGHLEIRYEHDIDTYHCDPFCSWQKGGVENVNGLIRQYIPKGANISNYTDEQIQEIENKLNNRPRKNLNYFSPNQVLAHLVVGIRT